jgi:hypothetical protein
MAIIGHSTVQVPVNPAVGMAGTVRAARQFSSAIHIRSGFIAFVRSGAVAVAVISISSALGVGVSEAKPRAEIAKMCAMDGKMTENSCIRSTCQGVCTVEALNRCIYFGQMRVVDCMNANRGDITDRAPDAAKPPKPKGPGKVTAPLSNPPTETKKNPKGPFQVTARPLSNPASKGGPSLR